jgi:predicted aspartyl protease
MRGPYLFLVLTTGLAIACPSQANAADRSISVPGIRDTAGSVPFDLYQGYCIVVHGSAGSLKNLNFFLDTGTSLSILDSRLARKLDLHSEEPASVVILGGRVMGGYANLPSVEVGPMQRSNLEVIAADLSFFQKYLPVRVDAIVGLDVLGQKPFVIDYSARIIRFGVVPALSLSIPLRLDGGLAVVDAEINHTPVHLLLDTGASSLVLFAKPTPRSSSSKTDAVLRLEAIGNFENKPVRLPSLSLGPEEFREKTALVTLNPKPSQLDFDGLMSPAALGISQVSVDLAAGVLAFSR